jgi:hypothetical protein
MNRKSAVGMLQGRESADRIETDNLLAQLQSERAEPQTSFLAPDPSFPRKTH